LIFFNDMSRPASLIVAGQSRNPTASYCTNNEGTPIVVFQIVLRLLTDLIALTAFAVRRRRATAAILVLRRQIASLQRAGNQGSPQDSEHHVRKVTQEIEFSSMLGDNFSALDMRAAGVVTV
jgi:hypothetical protein